MQEKNSLLGHISFRYQEEHTRLISTSLVCIGTGTTLHIKLMTYKVATLSTHMFNSKLTVAATIRYIGILVIKV